MAFGDTASLLDNFNRDNEGPPPSGAWGTPIGTWGTGMAVSSNQCAAAAAGTAGAFWRTPMTDDDGECYVTIAALNGSPVNVVMASVFIRFSDWFDPEGELDGFDGYEAAWEWWDDGNNGLTLYRWDNGVRTELDSEVIGGGLSAGNKFGIECVGTEIRTYYDTGGGWTVSAASTDATYGGAAYMGIGVLYQAEAWDAELDDFYGTAPATGTIKVYASDYDTDAGSPTHLRGDRASRDVNSQFAEHTNEGSTLLRHLPAPATAGHIAVDDSAKWNSVAISGDATLAADGTLTVSGIGGGLALTDLGSYSRGYIIRGGAADWEAYDASTNGAALVGDGTDIVSTTTPTWQGAHTFAAGLSVSAGQNIIVGSGGMVGIGAASPDMLVHIESATGNLLKAVNTAASSSSGGAGAQFCHDDGAAMGNGNRMGFFAFGGATDASHTLNNSVAVMGYASENWSAAAAGAELHLAVTPNNSTTRGTALIISNGGNVGIGIGNNQPDMRLHIEAATGNIVKLVNTDTSASWGGAGFQCLADDGAAMGSGHRMGFFTFGAAKDASHTVNNSVAMEGIATEAWGAAACGAKMQLATTPNGSTTRTTRVVIDNTGDVGIGSTATPTANSGKVLYFGDNTADPTMDTNTAGFYAKDVSGTVEAFCVDEADNATQLSPHDPETGEWIFYSRNARTGRTLKVQMEQLVRFLDAQFGTGFVREHLEEVA